MIVQCDKCRTKFRIADERVSDKGVKVRCSRCAHVFVVRKGQETTRLNPSKLMSLAAQTASGPDAPTGVMSPPGSGASPGSGAPPSFPPPATTEQAALALGFAGERADTEVLAPPATEAVTVQSKLPGKGFDPHSSHISLDLDGALPGEEPAAAPPSNGAGPSSGFDAAPLSRSDLPPLDEDAGFPPPAPASSPHASALGPSSSPFAPPAPPPPDDDPLGGVPSSLDLASDDIEDRFPPPPEGAFGGPPPPPPPSADVAPPDAAPAFEPPPPPEGLPQTMTSGGGYQFGGSHDFFESVDGGDIPGLLPPEALGDDDPFGGHDAPPPTPEPVGPLTPSGNTAPTPTAPFSDNAGVPLARIDLGKAAVPNFSDGANLEATAIAAAYDESSAAPVQRELPQVGERTGLWPTLVGAVIGGAIVAFALPDIGAGLVDRFSRRGADVISRVSRARVLPESLPNVRALDTHVTAYRAAGDAPVLVVRGLARNVGAEALTAPRAVVLAMRGDEVVGRAEGPTGVLLEPDVLTASEPSRLSDAFAARAAARAEATIEPGGEWPFMVVFAEVPQDASELLFMTEFLPGAPGT